MTNMTSEVLSAHITWPSLRVVAISTQYFQKVPRTACTTRVVLANRISISLQWAHAGLRVKSHSLILDTGSYLGNHMQHVTVHCIHTGSDGAVRRPMAQYQTQNGLIYRVEAGIALTAEQSALSHMEFVRSFLRGKLEKRIVAWLSDNRSGW